MSIRLRIVDGTLVALCAARSIEKPGDVYLDDNQHHALASKFTEDFTSEGGLIAVDLEESALRQREESNNPSRAWWDRTYGGIVALVVVLSLSHISFALAQDRLTDSLRRAVVAGQIADITVTEYQLAHGHRELNPALAWASEKPLAFAAVKIGGYLLTDVMLAKLGRTHRTAAVVTSLVLTGVYVGVVAHNARGIR